MDYLALIEREYGSGCSYLSTVVRDILGLILDRFRYQLAGVRVENGPDKSVHALSKDYSYVHRREDGRIFALDVRMFRLGFLEIYGNFVEPLYRHEIVSCLDVRWYGGDNCLYYCYPTVRGISVHCMDWDQLTDTSLLEIFWTDQALVTMISICPLCLDNHGMLLEIGDERGKKIRRYYPYLKSSLDLEIPSEINFSAAEICQMQFPQLMIGNQQNVEIWNLLTGQRGLNLPPADWVYLSEDLILISRKNSHQLIDLLTGRVIHELSLPSGHHHLYRRRSGPFSSKSGPVSSDYYYVHQEGTQFTFY